LNDDDDDDDDDNGRVSMLSLLAVVVGATEM
jgi:hypothetical protein